jgi:broad specificity phosphatase PhoE
MTANVAILQHGEKVPAAGDPGLTLLGTVQAMRGARRLASLAPSRLISSPMRRSHQTLAPLATATGLEVEVDPRLAERMNLEEATRLTDFVDAWSRTVLERDWTPPGGRSSRATAAAMREVLEEVAVADATVVLGSHGGATTDLLRDLLGDDELERRGPGLIRLGVPGGAVTTLARDGGVWAVDQIADVAHIPATERTGHVPAGVVPPA